MIRAVTTGSLVTVLMLALYLPSSQPPERFLAQLRVAHARNLTFWGEAIAERIFDRMLRLQDQAHVYSPVPTASSTSARAPASALFSVTATAATGPLSNVDVAPAVEKEMARVNARLFNNSYFRSINALFTLATYRLAT